MYANEKQLVEYYCRLYKVCTPWKRISGHEPTALINQRSRELAKKLEKTLDKPKSTVL